MMNRSRVVLGMVFFGMVFYAGCASSGRPYSLRGFWRVTRGELEEVSRTLSNKKTGNFRLASGTKDATCDTQRCELRWTASNVPVYRRGSRQGKVGKLNVKFYLSAGLTRDLLSLMNDMRAENGELEYERNDADIFLDSDILEVTPKINSKTAAKEELASGYIQTAVKAFVERAIK